MAKTRATPDAATEERQALIACHRIARRYMPAVEPEDFGHPIVAEMLDAHDRVTAELDRLARTGQPWPVVLDELQTFTAELDLPLLDELRDANGLGRYAEQVLS